MEVEILLVLQLIFDAVVNRSGKSRGEQISNSTSNSILTTNSNSRSN